MRYAVKAIKDKMRSNSLVPSLFVYGILPTFPTGTNHFKDQAARLGVLTAARAEKYLSTEVFRITTALHAKLTLATHHYLHVGQHIRVYHERSKLWEGPFKITRFDKKEAWIADGTKTPNFNLSQIILDPVD